jgi:hypothetical protein
MDENHWVPSLDYKRGGPTIPNRTFAANPEFAVPYAVWHWHGRELHYQ